MAFEQQAGFVQLRMAHIRDMDRDHDRTLARALAGCVRTCYGTAGRNAGILGINAFSPVPVARYIGNVSHGRVLKAKPEDMTEKWEYELDAEGVVLRARCYCDPPGVAENVLVPAAAPQERTYLQYWQRNGRERIVQNSISYAFDAQGRLSACLKLSWIGGFAMVQPELEEFFWDGERLLGVEQYSFWPLGMAACPDGWHRVTLLGENYKCLYRRVDVPQKR